MKEQSENRVAVLGFFFAVIVVVFAVMDACGEERWAAADSTFTILAFDTISHRGEHKGPIETQNLLRGYAGLRWHKTWGKPASPDILEELTLIPLRIQLHRLTPHVELSGWVQHKGELLQAIHWQVSDREDQFAPWVEGRRGDVLKRFLVFPLPGGAASIDQLTVRIDGRTYALRTVAEDP